MSDAARPGRRDGAALDHRRRCASRADRPPDPLPAVLLAVNVGGLDAATKLPGFPTDSYLDFAIAIPFMQGALFAAINAGTSLARDVETGFLNRLALTPMQRAALLLGNLAGVMAVALLSSACIYLAVGLAGGRWSFKAGVGGVLVLLALRAADRARASPRSARSSGCAPGRARRCRASSRCSSSSSSCPRQASRAADREGLVPHDRDVEPGLLPARGHPHAGHHRLGRRGARARLRRSRSCSSRARHLAAASRALRTRLVRT